MMRSFAFDVIPRQALGLEFFLSDIHDWLLKMFTPTTIIREWRLIGGDGPYQGSQNIVLTIFPTTFETENDTLLV
jgi:hypothetical protein